MCLSIPALQKQKRPTKIKRLFKYYTVPEHRKIDSNDPKLTVESPSQNNRVFLQYGRNVRSNRKGGTKLTNTELIHGRVSYGLHTFVHKKDAMEYAKKAAYKGNPVVVVSFIAFPKTFVARGIYGYRRDGTKILNEVHTKLEVYQIIGHFVNNKKVIGKNSFVNKL